MDYAGLVGWGLYKKTRGSIGLVVMILDLCCFGRVDALCPLFHDFSVSRSRTL